MCFLSVTVCSEWTWTSCTEHGVFNAKWGADVILRTHFEYVWWHEGNGFQFVSAGRWSALFSINILQGYLRHKILNGGTPVRVHSKGPSVTFFLLCGTPPITISCFHSSTIYSCDSLKRSPSLQLKGNQNSVGTLAQGEASKQKGNRSGSAGVADVNIAPWHSGGEIRFVWQIEDWFYIYKMW